MVHAKNYESASTFVKVIPRKLLASFFLDTVYFYAENKTHLSSVLTERTVAFMPLLQIYTKHLVTCMLVILRLSWKHTIKYAFK